MPGQVGVLEIAVVLVIALIVLGPKRLPQAGRSLGEGLRGFKEAVSGPAEPQRERELPAAVSASQLDDDADRDER